MFKKENPENKILINVLTILIDKHKINKINLVKIFRNKNLLN